VVGDSQVVQVVVVGKQVVVVGKQVVEEVAGAGTQEGAGADIQVVVIVGIQGSVDVEDMQEVKDGVQDTNWDNSLHRTEESSPRV